LLASKEKGAAIKMADFGLAVLLPKNQDKGWFGELQTFVSHFAHSQRRRHTRCVVCVRTP